MPIYIHEGEENYGFRRSKYAAYFRNNNGDLSTKKNVATFKFIERQKEDNNLIEQKQSGLARYITLPSIKNPLNTGIKNKRKDPLYKGIKPHANQHSERAIIASFEAGYKGITKNAYWIKSIYTEREPCHDGSYNDPCNNAIVALEKKQIAQGGPPIVVYYSVRLGQRIKQEAIENAKKYPLSEDSKQAENLAKSIEKDKALAKAMSESTSIDHSIIVSQNQYGDYLSKGMKNLARYRIATPNLLKTPANREEIGLASLSNHWQAWVADLYQTVKMLLDKTNDIGLHNDKTKYLASVIFKNKNPIDPQEYDTILEEYNKLHNTFKEHYKETNKTIEDIVGNSSAIRRLAYDQMILLFKDSKNDAVQNLVKLIEQIDALTASIRREIFLYQTNGDTKIFTNLQAKISLYRDIHKAIQENTNIEIDLPTKDISTKELFFNQHENYISIAEELFKSGDFKQAKFAAQKSIENGYGEKGYKLLAEIEFELGHYASAIENYGKYIQVDSNDSEIFYKKALSHSKLGEYKNAIKDLNKSIEINPNNTSARLLKGELLLKSEDYLESLNEFEYINNNNLASQNHEQSMAHEYIKQLKQKITDQKTEANDLYEKAVKLFEGKNYPEAEEHFNKAIKLDPKHAEAHYGLGRVFHFTERYFEAVKKYIDAEKINKQHEFIKNSKKYTDEAMLKYQIQSAKKCMSKENYNMAVHYYSLALKNQDIPARSKKEIVRGLQGITHHLKTKNDYEGAYNVSLKLIEADKDNYVNFMMRGICLFHLKNYNQAKEDYEQALSIANKISSPTEEDKKNIEIIQKKLSMIDNKITGEMQPRTRYPINQAIPNQKWQEFNDQNMDIESKPKDEIIGEKNKKRTFSNASMPTNQDEILKKQNTMDKFDYQTPEHLSYLKKYLNINQYKNLSDQELARLSDPDIKKYIIEQKVSIQKVCNASDKELAEIVKADRDSGHSFSMKFL